ncbi:hypothetical protein [Oceanospirillum sediminis]|uniref:Uncharacterized protein n=1 Tax=Oceanospirillum sediminis TaxID=2760088 RepID=A0A839ITD0_9GAMM|nr:hypothetical protein [Oceanospirillum sediminis]MBB1488713.1 hypothetical protein [Oceanospirillum sediminis]
MAASKGLQKTASDFYVGGRNFGLLTVTATQMASAFGGGMMVAYVSISTVLVWSLPLCPLFIMLITVQALVKQRRPDTAEDLLQYANY